MSTQRNSSLGASARETVENAKAVAIAAGETAQQADRHAVMAMGNHIQSVMLDPDLGASPSAGSSPRPGAEPDSGKPPPSPSAGELLAEIHTLLNAQNKAAQSQTGCRSRLLADLAPLTAELKDASANGKTPSQDQLEKIAKQMANAIAIYSECMKLLRPKFVSPEKQT